MIWAFCHIYCEMKNTLSTQTVNILGNVNISLKGHRVIFKDQGGTLQKDFHHINVEVSLLGMKRGYVLTNGGEIERTWLLFTLSLVMYGTWLRASLWASVMGQDLCHFPSTLLFRMDLLLKIRNFLVEKYTLTGFRWSGALFIQYFQVQKDELILEENDIELESNSAALIQQDTTVKNKAIRRNLDAIYTSKKGKVQQTDE